MKTRMRSSIALFVLMGTFLTCIDGHPLAKKGQAGRALGAAYMASLLGGLAGELCQKLQNRGIQVRYFSTPVLQNYIRISVGKPEHTDILIRALQKIGKEING